MVGITAWTLFSGILPNLIHLKEFFASFNSKKIVTILRRFADISFYFNLYRKHSCPNLSNTLEISRKTLVVSKFSSKYFKF